MALGDDVIWLAGLIEMQLPTGTVRLSDCAAVKWGATLYDGVDAAFGVVAAMAEIEEGIADELPAWQVTFHPEQDAHAVTVANPAFQGARIFCHLAEIVAATGLVTGTPDLVFDGIIDVPTLRMGKNARAVDFTVVGRSDKLFLLREGNTLSRAFHTSIWLGENGFDNATGIEMAVPWGVKSPPRGTAGPTNWGGGYGGGGGFGDGSGMDGGLFLPREF
jgi:hypothetical protein